MPYGNGDLYQQIAGTFNASQLTNVQSIFDNLTNFDPLTYLNTMTTRVNTALT